MNCRSQLSCHLCSKTHRGTSRKARWCADLRNSRFSCCAAVHQLLPSTRLYVYTCTHTHIYAHIYIHRYTHIHLHIYIHTHAYTCTISCNYINMVISHIEMETCTAVFLILASSFFSLFCSYQKTRFLSVNQIYSLNIIKRINDSMLFYVLI